MDQTDRLLDRSPLSETVAAEAIDGALVDLRCSVALVKNDQILLLHRTAHPDLDHDGDWILPGGHPVDGEAMGACATRETREETGLSVDVGRCLFVYEVVGPTKIGRRVELVFAATTLSFAALGSRETDRHAELVSLDDLHVLNLRPPLAGYLRGLNRPQQAGAPYLGNLWRPHRSA